MRLRYQLSAVLRERFKDVAMPGEHWNGGDVGPPGLGFDFIWHSGNRWVFLVGRGGFVTTFNVSAYDVSDDGEQATEVPISGQAQNLCELATKYAHP